MRRADRLFQIVGLLDKSKAITAYTLSEALGVSVRTIYRDIQDLSLSGVPIEAETGVGYRLMKGFHLPSLMFDEEELAALMLGAKMVQAWTDKNLARSAHQALRKIENMLPEKLRPELERAELFVPDFNVDSMTQKHLGVLRVAIKTQHKVLYDYVREDGQSSSRTVLPLGLFYWGRVWTLVAWCELRDDFRHFRLDRMTSLEPLKQSFKLVEGRRLQDYLDTVVC